MEQALRQQKYLDFAAKLAAPCRELHWQAAVEARGGLAVRLVGLNSALLCTGGNDAGRLEVTDRQRRRLTEPAPGPAELVVTLQHHPVGLPGPHWLKPEEATTHDRWLLNHAHVSLCGHVHDPDSALIQPDGLGRAHIRVVAGAGHLEAKTPRSIARHAYSLAAVERDVDGALFLHIWPRVWSPKNADFRPDHDNVPLGKASVSHRLGLALAAARPAPALTSPRPLPVAPALTPPPRDPWPDYLKKVVNECATIRVDGFAEGHVKPLPLDRVYVRLRMVAPRAEMPRPDLRGRGRAPKVTPVEDARPDRGDAGLPELLAPPCWALVGDPGSGKSTVLKYIALRLARYHLEGLLEGAAELGFGGGRTDSGLLLSVDSPPPRPLLLDLPTVADMLRDKLGKTRRMPTRDEWLAVLDGRLGGAGIAGAAEAALTEGGVLLLFDALDEVGEAKDRVWLVRAVCELSNWFGGAGGHRRHNGFGIACRTRAWTHEAVFAHFAEAHLEPLDDDQIAEFVRKWFGVLPDADESLPEGLLERVRLAPAVRKIARSPQLLTMLCVLYAGKKSLPEARSLLYKEVVDHQLRRHGAALVRWGGELKVRRLLRGLAWEMQSGGTGAVGTEPRDTLPTAAAARLLAPEAEVDEDVALVELLHDLDVHTGLLSTGGPTVRFVHRTLQEFLVAERIAAQPAREMGERAHTPAWAEVVGLVAGILAERDQDSLTRYLADLVGGDGGTLEARAARVATAALCLPDLETFRLKGAVVAPVTAGLAAVLPVVESAESKAEDRVRIAVADALGRVKDPRLTEAQRWVELPAREFWRGAIPDDREADSDERPAGLVRVSAFAIQRWPVVVAEFREFLDAGGYSDPRLWTERGWASRSKEGATAPNEWDRQLERLNPPVTGVSFWEAEAYCNWLDAAMRARLEARVVRLPTEAEWERAARGLLRADGRTSRFPWGDEPAEGQCNFGGKYARTTPVGAFGSVKSLVSGS